MLLDRSIHAYPRLCHINLSTALRRATRRTRFQGSHAFHLVHTLFTTKLDKNSAKALATVTKKRYPHAENLSLKLIHKESDEVLTMTLSQALQLLKPRSYLAEAEPGTYRIQTFPEPRSIEVALSKALPRSYKPFTRAGRGKEAHLTTTYTPQSLHHLLSTSYKYILEGTRMEFHLRQKSNNSKGRTVDWALANCMHLRPDSILAAMPEGTTMLAEPAVTDLSFKTKLPKNLQEQMSQVMWALENEKALQRAGEGTSKRVKMLARWPEEKHLRNGASHVTTPVSP